MSTNLNENRYNHDYFLKDQKHLGQAVLPGYALYNLGASGHYSDNQERVMGELYEIDHQVLRRLDMLEGMGTCIYDILPRYSSKTLPLKYKCMFGMDKFNRKIKLSLMLNPGTMSMGGR